MKHFIIDINFVKPFEEIEGVVPNHRAFLQEGYDAGVLLASGPKVPRTGGMVIAREESIEKIEALFANDPYKLAGVAEYTFVEFNPVKYQSVLENWVTGK